jgi:hypothetical protein
LTRGSITRSRLTLREAYWHVDRNDGIDCSLGEYRSKVWGDIDDQLSEIASGFCNNPSGSAPIDSVQPLDSGIHNFKRSRLWYKSLRPITNAICSSQTVNERQ